MPHEEGHEPMDPERQRNPQTQDDDQRGTTPMTGTTPSETAKTTPGGDVMPASPGGDRWEQADDTESTERRTGS